MSDRIRVSQSWIQDWQSCQYRFGLVHIDNLVRRYPTRPLAVGTLIHAGLEGFLLAQFKNKKITREQGRAAIFNAITARQNEFIDQDYIKPYVDNEWKEQALQFCSDAATIALRCVEWLGFFSKDCDWETLAYRGTPLVEFEMLETHKYTHNGKKFEYDLGGKLDWAVRRKSIDRNFLIDFKSRDQMKRTDYDHRQVQSPLYQYLLQKKGIEIHGTGTLQIRRAVPEVPRQNKTKPKGETLYPMSRESITTDWPTYEKALVDAGLDPAAYQDVKAKLKPFFSISPEIRGEIEIAGIVENVHRAARDALSTPREEFHRSRFPMNCEGCDFEELCTADLLGHDVDFLKHTSYHDRNKPEFVVPDFENDMDESNDEFTMEFRR